MGAPDLLLHLQRTGFKLWVTDTGGIRVTPASALSEADRDAIRVCRPELRALLNDTKAVDPVPVCPARALWTEDDIASFTARWSRLKRWGWRSDEAEAFAERLTLNTLNGDDRVTCAADCQSYRPGHCATSRRAGLTTSAVGPDLARLPQRCPGFQETSP